MRKTSRASSRPFTNMFFMTIAGAAAALPLLVPAEALARRAGSPAEQAKPQLPKGPLTLVVSIRNQRVSVYGPNGKITESPVSTGRSGHDTPTGVFSIVGKEVMHHSNLYGDAPMPFMNRITWSGVALHAGALPGYPASHGCIRLPYGFARTLYGMTRMGTRVIVARDDAAPHPIAHDALFTPLPSGGQLASAATLAAAASTKVSDIGGLVPALVGITPAAAAEHPPAGAKPHRTREIAAAERAAEMQRLTVRIKDIEERRAGIDAQAREAARLLDEAKLATRDIRAEGERLARSVERLENELQTAGKELERLGATGDRLRGEVAVARAAEREEALERRIQSLTDDLDLARQDQAAFGPALAEAEASVEKAESSRSTETARLRAVLDELREAQAAKAAADKAEANRAKPITILVSRKTGKLHVRQGYDDVFETPVTIADSARPLGTHVYTALDYIDGDQSFRWHVVTAAAGDAPKAKKRDDDEPRRNKQRRPAPVETGTLPASDAVDALDRITIPEAARERIAELIKPGSSLMISDYGISHETGKYTDYILLTR